MYTRIDRLYYEYTHARFLDINKEQFIYIMHLLPSCLIVMSDGLLERDEWTTLKRLTKLLGRKMATDDLGIAKEENLMLIYKAEMRYLLRTSEYWQDKFLEALKDYMNYNKDSRMFVEKTMKLFIENEDGPHSPEFKAYQKLSYLLNL